MKAIAIILIALFASAAHAATIEASSSTMNPAFCYTECSGVPNTGGVFLWWSTPSIYGGVTVGINGDYYSAVVSKYPVVVTGYENLVLTDPSGHTITVSASWNTGRRCSSGRAGGCANVYELVSGTITL